MRILMLGNSFTYYHDMPERLAKYLDAEVVAHTRGGASLREHLNPETEHGRKTLAALKNEKWDYVILQEQSNAPVTRRENFLASARELCALIRENGAKPLFYATWAYRDGSEKLSGMNMSYEEMADGLYEAYHQAAAENGALIADAGKKFADLRKSFGESTGYLYAADGYHPSLHGTAKALGEIGDAIKQDIYGEAYDQLMQQEAQKKLSARDKRKLLEKYLGERLLANGFFRKNGAFYRIIPGAALLTVSLRIYIGGDCELVFDAREFGNKFLPEKLKEKWPDSYLGYTLYHYSLTFPMPRPFELQIMMQCDHFLECFFERFNRIDSLEALYEYRLAPDLPDYSNAGLINTAVQLKQFDRLAADLRKKCAQEREKIRSLKAEEAELRKRVEAETLFSVRRVFEGDISGGKRLIEIAEEDIAEMEALAARLEAGDYADLEQEVQQRVDNSIRLCKEFFGKHYPAEN